MTPTSPSRVSASVEIHKAALQRVFDNLREAGFMLIGPTLRGGRDGAIVLDEIERLEDLPAGWREETAPGRYRLKKTDTGRFFDFTVGPHSWKSYLFPPRLTLFAAERNNGQWEFHPHDDQPPPLAFIGVRACDLHAIGVQDRVFLGGEYRDAAYARRREAMFIVAVNCSRAASTCFCSSMKTGPRAQEGFDLALTELADSFLVEIGSEAGSQMLRETGWEPATAFDLGRAAQETQRAEREIERRLATDDLPGLLYDNLEHPRWDAVAARCLCCANCTLVCPTCFCNTVEDASDLRGTRAERTRVWDSCFISDFSHVHGGNIRPNTRSRYRQWLTHKLASWIDQFGTSGCTGCGRCITWCPVGIDITEEVRAIRETAAK